MQLERIKVSCIVFPQDHPMCFGVRYKYKNGKSLLQIVLHLSLEKFINKNFYIWVNRTDANEPMFSVMSECHLEAWKTPIICRGSAPEFKNRIVASAQKKKSFLLKTHSITSHMSTERWGEIGELRSLKVRTHSTHFQLKISFRANSQLKGWLAEKFKFCHHVLYIVLEHILTIVLFNKMLIWTLMMFIIETKTV